MGLFHTVMNKLGRYRLIPDRRTGLDYLKRYYLFIRDRKNFPFNIVLHKILRSDDRIMHDHPWDYTTIILKGGYWEHTLEWNSERTAFKDVKTWRGPGSVISRRAESFHWLELDNEQPATTLFIMKKQRRAWGFLADKVEGRPVWVDADTYLNEQEWKTYHLNFVQPITPESRAA